MVKWTGWNIKRNKKENSCCLIGDARCDSPWHNTKYLAYSFLDQSSDNIAGFVVTHCTEPGNSNRMEKYAFEKLLVEMQNNEIRIFPNYNRSPCSTQKCMRENHKDINHQSDIWHVCESLNKHLPKSA